jgi:hypothetical protein
MLISESGGNFSLQNASGFMDKTSRRDDSLFSRQDTGTPSSSISPFSPSLTADDFPGYAFLLIVVFVLLWYDPPSSVCDYGPAFNG